MLAYCGVDYETKTYIRGASPDFSKQDWLQEKKELDLDFPNLPYLIDGDFKMTESKSIMKYIASKHDPSLLGSTAEEVAKADMMSRVHDQLNLDLGNGFKKNDMDAVYK
jgi:glutathione S-transferase